MSYSYYLVHGLALKAYFRLFDAIYPARADTSFLFWLLLPAMFSLTLVPSAILFLGIERRFSLKSFKRTARAVADGAIDVGQDAVADASTPSVHRSP